MVGEYEKLPEFILQIVNFMLSELVVIDVVPCEYVVP